MFCLPSFLGNFCARLLQLFYQQNIESVNSVKIVHRITMIFPLLKLGTLALKTACKPFARRLKKEAGLHPRFRNVIINMAQANHRFTTKMQRRIYGRAVDADIRPLNEEKAVQAAADLIGELFVFMVAGTAIIFEVHRSSKAEARKEERRRKELEEMKQKDERLELEISLLKQKIEELEQIYTGQWLTGQGLTGQGLTGQGLTGQGLTGQGLTGQGLTGQGLTGQGLTGQGLTGQGLTGQGLTGHGLIGFPKVKNGHKTEST